MQAQGCLLSSEKLAGIPCEFCFQIANPFFFVFHVLFASVFAQVQRKGVKASLSARIHTGIPSEIRARLQCKFANQNSHAKFSPKIRTHNSHLKIHTQNSRPKFTTSKFATLQCALTLCTLKMCTRSGAWNNRSELQGVNGTCAFCGSNLLLMDSWNICFGP